MLFSRENADLFVMYAISPVHAGTGQATGAVDLPIQRERHTSWPQIQSSGMKGAFRDWFRRYYEANPEVAPENGAKQAEELAKKVFGAEEGGENNAGFAGAISITDARLLAFPVRSNAAPFVWVICPALLTRLARDLKVCHTGLNFPEISVSGKDHAILVSGNIPEKEIVLEDLAVEVQPDVDPEKIAALKSTMEKLAPQVKRLLLISDENFTFLVKTATEVQPHIKIDYKTGTTADGSLRYQELLPSDSVLYSLVFFSNQRGGESPMMADMLRDLVKSAVSNHIQVGGDMTMGRGLMEVAWVSANGR